MKKINKISRVFLFFLAVSTLTPVVGQSLKQKVADKAFENFEMLKAAEMYEEIVYKEQTCDNMKKLAECYRYLGNYSKAEYWYSYVVKCEPKDKDFFYYAMALKRNGKYQEASRIMEIYYEKQPNNSIAKEHHNIPADYYELLKQDSAQFQIYHAKANSAQSDFGAVYYQDDILFASSRRNTSFVNKKNAFDDTYFYSLYSMKDSVESEKSKPINDLNSVIHHGPIAFSPDYKRFYLSKSVYNEKNIKSKIANIELYTGKVEDGEFNIEKELEFGAPEASNGQACISPDGNTLYFVSDRKGGYGNTDIWKTTLVNNEWGTPENLGPEINTEESELFPFLDNEGNLYFSSEGHVGLGGFDIYVARLADGGKKYLVSNIGYPINTKEDDLSFVVNREKKEGYFSSNRFGGFGEEDIYMYTFEELEVPEPPKEPDTTLVVEEPDTVLPKEPQILDPAIANVYFDFDKSNIRAQEKDKLTQLIAFLNEHKKVKLSMTGHTDKRASDAYNKALSVRRAKSVLNYLIKNGVEKNRIVWTAEGESNPYVKCDNCSKLDHQMNRRVEFKILNEKNELLYKSKPIL